MSNQFRVRSWDEHEPSPPLPLVESSYAYVQWEITYWLYLPQNHLILVPFTS